MAVDEVDPFPWFLHKSIQLVINHRHVAMHLTTAEWTEHWRPFLGRLMEIQRKRGRRLLVAVAGAPGSGKSFFAEQISWMATRGVMPGIFAAALPMDGFHYDQEYLLTHHQTFPDGSRIPLAQCKGSPLTFNVEALRHHLTMLRDTESEISWPGYNRELHDTVQDEFRVPAGTNLAIVEGNYLLLNVPPYKGIPDFFDLKIYIEAPAPVIMANLMSRHMAGGRDVEDAKTWVKRVDLPNARIVESTRGSADVIIRRDRQDLISAVIWKSEKPPAK
ncbi:MAG: hypothetical protein ACP5O7_02190 [Phycisphaerae bacterium]